MVFSERAPGAQPGAPVDPRDPVDPQEPADPAHLSDGELAGWLARAAGARLLEVRASGATGRELKDAGDAAAQALLAQALGRLRPHDAVLSEEAVDDRARLSARRVWIIDPLDGTREFSEPPREDWAVHVALWEDGRLVEGAVALPARGTTLTTSSPSVPPPPHPGRLRVLVSRTRPPQVALAVARALDAELVEMGSAGAKAAAVVLGQGEVYVHAGGQYEWDSAAPVAVCRAAGLHCSRVDGSELVYNQPDVRLPDLLVCRPELASTVLATIAAQGVTP